MVSVKVSDQAYDAFREGYATAMLWANAFTGDGWRIIDATYAYVAPGRWWMDLPDELDDPDFFSDANDFLRENYDLLLSASDDFSQHGHDFALTRNGHGTGFWDRGYGDVGERLTDLAHAYGGAEVIIPGWDGEAE